MEKNKPIFLSVIIVVLGFASISSFAQTWTSIDGGGTYISSATSQNSILPSVAVFNGEMYVIWQEYTGSAYEVHIKKYNKLGWTTAGNYLDGTLLYSSSFSTTFPKLVSFNGSLYAAWSGSESGANVVHVKKFDGSAWSFVQNYAFGDGRSNINHNVIANATKIDLCVFNNELYAIWVEQYLGTGRYQVRASKYNGTTWTSVDGDGNYGINYNTAFNASYPTLCVFNNVLYAAWAEKDVMNYSQLRVKRYEGGNTWTFVDGNGANGLNYDVTRSLSDVPLSLLSYKGKMYALWSESNKIRSKCYDETNGWVTYPADGGYGWDHYMSTGGDFPSGYSYDKLYATWEQYPEPKQVRVASYDGTTKTFIDNGVDTGINNTTANRARFPKLTVYLGNLYAIWSEEVTSTPGSANQIRAKTYPLPPIVESVSVPANATYIIGQPLNFTVNFSKSVTVAGGTPYIPITLNTGGTVNATYQSGSGSAALTFRYTVATGTADPDGITVGSGIVLPGGCTLRDATSLDTNLTLNSIGSTTSVQVDGIAPTVSSINRQTPATSPTNAASLVYRVTFNRSVTGVGASDFKLTTSGEATGGTIASVAAISGSVYDVTVNSLLGYGTFRLDLNSSGTGITDTSGNPISGGYTGGQTYTNTNLATLTTQAVSGIGSTTATGNGNITDLGYPNPTAYGICWNTSSGPTTSDNKTDAGAASATGTFTGSMTGLTAGTTYYVKAYATNSAGTSYGSEVTFTTYAAASTWTGTGNWSTAGNWSAGIPGPETDVTIASGTCTLDNNYPANHVTIHSGAALTVSSGKTLTINGNLSLKSDAAGTASLINNGTLTIAGTTYTERYLTGNKWHVVSPTADGGSISAFIQAAGNAIPVNGSNYGMMDYNETLNAWNSYFTTSASGNMASGKGYSVRRTSDGVVTFSGTLTSGDKSVSLSKGGEGWNCVGNPYPSAINMNMAADASNNFLSKNSSVLDPAYACMYVWDQDASGYKILGGVSFGARDLGQNVFHAGQGFLVKAAGSGSSVQFTSAMQVHQNGAAFKSGGVSWPGFELTATAGAVSASTVVAFNSAMTRGLDPTYDAGLLRGTSGLHLYSRLLDDNGVDFAIQCLPESDKSLVIPVGLDSQAGGEISFSAEATGLPANYSLIMEDKLTGSITPLEKGQTYKVAVTAGTKGIGRFYLHAGIGAALTLRPIPDGQLNLKAYPANGEIVIEGEVSNQAQALLFDAGGRKLGQFLLQQGNRNTLPAAGLTRGIYMLKVTDGSDRFSTKIVIL